jgi:hypothetical protein
MRTHKIVFRLVMLGALLIALFGCASARPCPPPPPPQVIEGPDKPVVQPWPEPPIINLPVLKMPTLSSTMDTIQDLLLAAIHDADEWQLTARKALAALDAYRHKDPNK